MDKTANDSLMLIRNRTTLTNRHSYICQIVLSHRCEIFILGVPGCFEDDPNITKDIWRIQRTSQRFPNMFRTLTNPSPKICFAKDNISPVLFGVNVPSFTCTFLFFIDFSLPYYIEIYSTDVISSFMFYSVCWNPLFTCMWISFFLKGTF